MANPEFWWFPLEVRTWLTDEAVMTMPCLARGAYIQLLCCQWENESLPDDTVALAMLARIHNRECAAYEALETGHGSLGGMPQNMLFEQEIWPYLEELFPPCPDGRRRNPKLDRERTKRFANHEERSKSGRKGALQGWMNKRLASSATSSATAKRQLSSSISDADADEEPPLVPPKGGGGVCEDSKIQKIEDQPPNVEPEAQRLLALWREKVNSGESLTALVVLRARLVDGWSGEELTLAIERKAAEVRSEGKTSLRYKLKNFLGDPMGAWKELLAPDWKAPTVQNAASKEDEEYERDAEEFRRIEREKQRNRRRT